MKNALLLIAALAIGCGGESSLPKMSDAGLDSDGHDHVHMPDMPPPSTSGDGMATVASVDAGLSPASDAAPSVGADASASADSNVLVSETGKPLQPSPILDAAPPRLEDAGSTDARMIVSTDTLGPPVPTTRTDAGPRPLVYVDNLDSLGGASCPAEKSWVFPLELNSVYCGTIAEACRAVCKAAECRVANHIQGLQETYCLDRLPEP